MVVGIVVPWPQATQCLPRASHALTAAPTASPQMGAFSEQLLRAWPSCTRMYLVDVWGQQANYQDAANVADAQQEAFYQQARRRLAPWKDKTIFLRQLTLNAAKAIPDNSLDFIYVDAR